MKYETLTEEEQRRISFETVQGLPVDQFEAALSDTAILLDDEELRGLLHTLEADHVRATVRAEVAPEFPAPPGGPPASNPGLVGELERRIEAVKAHLKL